MIRAWALLLLFCGAVWAKPAITLDVHQADVRKVLHHIAEDAGLNLVVDDRVQGRVTVALTRVSHVEALKAVAASVGARVEISGVTGLVR